MTTPLSTSRPSEQGVDAAGITAFLDALESNPQIELHSIMLLRHGHLVASAWWSPYSWDRPHLVYSLTKSFCSSALGLAVDAELIGLDDTVLSWFPELDTDVQDARSRRMRVRHVAAMASGHGHDTFATAAALDPVNLLRGFLLTPPDHEPGSTFAYNQPCTYAIAALVERASGMSLPEFLGPRLLEPLGIGGLGWKRDATGQVLGFSGLHARTDAVARLGQLHLQRGVWEGRRILSEEWVEQATGVQVDNPDEPNEDSRQGYGFQFWNARHGFRGDGAYGQFCVVLPDEDAVLAMTAATEEMQDVLDAAWTHLLPAMTASPLDDSPLVQAAEDDLALRLRTAALPAVRADAEPPDAVHERWSGWHGTAAGWDTNADGTPAVRALGVRRDAEGWWLDLADDTTTLPVRLGTSGWAVSGPQGPDGRPVPVATSGGWTGDGRLVADVVLLETPHRFRLSVDPDAATATAHWVTRPLHDTQVHLLRSPGH